MLGQIIQQVERFIQPYVFLLSLSIGLLYVYLTADTPQIIYKHPTPYNVDDITYRDSANQCYKYKVTTMSCPKDTSKIQTYSFE